jgi:hypothetical protein
MNPTGSQYGSGKIDCYETAPGLSSREKDVARMDSWCECERRETIEDRRFSNWAGSSRIHRDVCLDVLERTVSNPEVRKHRAS